MPESVIDALVDGGKASAGPPLGPALGPTGINIGKVIATINEQTKDFAGMQVPVKVIINSSDKSFRIEVGSPPASALLKKELGIEHGSGLQKLEKSGDLPMQGVVRVARMKRTIVLAKDLKKAAKEVLGTCVSMGLLVDGKDPREIQKLVDKGDYDALFVEGANLDFDRATASAISRELQGKLTLKPKVEEKVAPGAEGAAPAEGAAAPVEAEAKGGKAERAKGKGKEAPAKAAAPAAAAPAAPAGKGAPAGKDAKGKDAGKDAKGREATKGKIDKGKKK